LKYLLDTNACISVLRSPHTSKIAQRLSTLLPGEARICSVVRMELIFGAYRSKQVAATLTAVEDLLLGLPSLPIDDAVANTAGRIRAELAALGTPVGPYDALIAACGLTHGIVIVTRNVAEFGRVAGLSVENWEV
jgi:tRNA(fMet)-specific endonuclease VapC